MEKQFENQYIPETPAESEQNPRLAFDALMGGVKAGGLRSVSSIYLLVSYIVSHLSGAVTAEVIANALAEGELANYFEVNNAIAHLIENGTILEEDGALKLNSDFQAEIELIEIDLPYTVRVSAIELCQKIIAKEKYRRENKTEIRRDGDHYTVELHVSGGDTDYMMLRLFAPTYEQAEMIREKFLTDPSKVYKNFIDSIFENKE